MNLKEVTELKEAAEKLEQKNTISWVRVFFTRGVMKIALKKTWR